MAVFRFRLERLLEHRRRAEREKQRAVATLEGRRLELEQSIRLGQRSIMSSKQDLRQALHSGGGVLIDPRSIRLQANASLHQLARTQQLALQLAGVHKKLGAARNVLIDAMRQRKAVEMLRERQLERWRAEQARLERNEMDEIAAIRASRRATGAMEAGSC